MLYCTSCESLRTLLACITAVLRYLLEASAVQSDFASKATQLETRLLALHADTVDSANAGLHAVLIFDASISPLTFYYKQITQQTTERV